MSLESALIDQSYPYLVTSQLSEILASEAGKGCDCHVHPHPVQLEPAWHPISKQTQPFSGDLSVAENLETEGFIRYKIWISPLEKFAWNKCERFIKLLAACRHRIGFEIAGNVCSIDFHLFCHNSDLTIIKSCFLGEFEESQLFPSLIPRIETIAQAQSLYWQEFFPQPPFHHLFTSYDEFKSTPFTTLLQALKNLPPDYLGFYQCLFQVTQHPWHMTVERLQDVEYMLKLYSNMHATQSLMQQPPSGDLRITATELDAKANNDKPFFAVLPRIGIATTKSSLDKQSRCSGLSAWMYLFQHGGKPLQSIGSECYQRHVTSKNLPAIILKGIPHRHGFLLNSKELTGLAHSVSARILPPRELPVDVLEPLHVKDDRIMQGTIIGKCHFGDEIQQVCIPQLIRERTTHILASAGMGKTNVMMNMFLQDIAEGKGSVFIDPHGDCVRYLLRCIPAEHTDKCIYFDPGNPDWIPSWNPLNLPDGTDPYRLADDLLNAFMRISKDWGDRLGHVLRNGFIGLCQLDRSTLMDLCQLTRQDSDESKALCDQLKSITQDRELTNFWEKDFKNNYTKKDLASPQHKLDKLIRSGESVRLMLSQKESTIDLNKIMDEGKILLVNLSNVGQGAREILGSFILTMLMVSALARSKIMVGSRQPFSIFADEAHLFAGSDTMENIITQCRKYSIELTIAHQYMSQFKDRQTDALSTVGTSIIGRLDKKDSQHFTKDMQDLVTAKDILSLEPFNMFARIGTQVIKIQTYECKQTQGEDSANRIIQQSFQRYYRKAAEIRQEQQKAGTAAVTPQTVLNSIPLEKLRYETF